MISLFKFLLISITLLGALSAKAKDDSIYNEELKRCQAGKINIDAAVRDFFLIKDRSIDTWLAMMGSAEKAAEMIRTRGLGEKLHQQLSSPDSLRAIQDCFPNSPAHQWMYIVSEAALGYEGLAIGSGLIVLTFYMPNVFLNALEGLTAFLPLILQSGWVKMIKTLRFSLYGLGIYALYELVMSGVEVYLNYQDPARPAVRAMKTALNTAIEKEQSRVRDQIMTEWRQLRRRVMSLRYPPEKVREMRERLRVLDHALEQLSQV